MIRIFIYGSTALPTFLLICWLLILFVPFEILGWGAVVIGGLLGFCGVSMLIGSMIKFMLE